MDVEAENTAPGLEHSPFYLLIKIKLVTFEGHSRSWLHFSLAHLEGMYQITIK